MPADSSRININADGTKQHTYDAIVIGSGISGGQPKPVSFVYGSDSKSSKLCCR